uniref:DNA-directed RNA polymerase subunit beta n=1 Tax=Zeugodacus cucurbitae TaxID=28588 RepID=A0A0A1WYK6_ZEUCU
MEDLNICIVSLVIIVFLLFIIRILSLSIRNIILLRQLQYEARLRAQGSGNACTPPANGNCTDNVAPRCDNPPTYETAMANYIDAKQQLRQMEEGAVAGAMAMSASTTTIETCISDVGQSRTDLRPNTTEDVTATGSVVFNTTNETTKPPL